MMRNLSPYIAAFRAGATHAVVQKSEIVSTLVVYAVLMCVFANVYDMTPVAALGLPGLTPAHLLWYFAITELLIVTAGGMAQFGYLVSEGRFTEMMQRPVSMIWMVVARFMGVQLSRMAWVSGFMLAVIPFFRRIEFDWTMLPVVMVSLVLASVLFQLLVFLVGLVELFGSYSRQMSWIVGKFVFSLGGLFFPVLFFPPVVREIAWMTPFPAILYVPASVVFNPGHAELARGLLLQVGWIVVIALLAVCAERKMTRRVMERGE